MNLPTLHRIPRTERTVTRSVRRLLPRLTTLTLLAGSLFGGLDRTGAAHAAGGTTIWITEPSVPIVADTSVSATYVCPFGYGSFGVANNPSQKPYVNNGGPGVSPSIIAGGYGSPGLTVLYSDNYQYAASTGSVRIACFGSGIGAGAVANDTDPSVQYFGNWRYQSGRPAAFNDYQGDVHDTDNDRDAVTFNFYGTGVTMYSEISADEGTASVWLDGSMQPDVNLHGTVQNVGGQPVYSISGLPNGFHQLTLMNNTYQYMLVDAFAVTP